MFDNGDESLSLSDVTDAARSAVGRSQDDECDFCGASEGSMIVNREENHPDVQSPPVVRCKTCYNDPDTYPEDEL